MRIGVLALATSLVVAAPATGTTNNILITGYWPNTNEMIRPFSTNSIQNPSGWMGENWSGLGYNVYSFFPEFPSGLGQGIGDFEVDYQDTSADWWRITADVQPVAIVTFSRGNVGLDWELEFASRNLSSWFGDYAIPSFPTPNPPDSSVPAGTIRYSTLPLAPIVDAVSGAGLGLNPYIDWTGFGGGFVSEFIAYHGKWYQSMHGSEGDPIRCVAAGHIHVGTDVTAQVGLSATELTLREVIRYVDSQVPAPMSTLTVGALAAISGFRRRRERSASRVPRRIDRRHTPNRGIG